MTDPLALVEQRFRATLLRLGFGDIDPVVRPSDRADAQVNVALGLGRALGRQAPELAAELIERHPERVVRRRRSAGGTLRRAVASAHRRGRPRRERVQRPAAGRGGGPARRWVAGGGRRRRVRVPARLHRADGGYGYAATDLAALRFRVVRSALTWAARPDRCPVRSMFAWAGRRANAAARSCGSPSTARSGRASIIGTRPSTRCTHRPRHRHHLRLLLRGGRSVSRRARPPRAGRDAHPRPADTWRSLTPDSRVGAIG